jgi:photosystem II stability/assembly factor-like uncharacterized protein
VLYVVTAEKGGVYSSSDGGRSWRHLGVSVSSSNFYSLRVSSEGHLFLATYDEILFSKDGGASWSSLKGGGQYKDFFSTKSGTFLGIHWNDGMYRRAREKNEFLKADGQDGGALVLDIVEGSEGRLWAATLGDGVLSSQDGGASWYMLNDGLENRFVLSLAPDPETEALFAGTLEGGVFRKRKDASWERVQDGLPPRTTVQAIAVTGHNTVWAGTHGNGLFVSRYGGQTWEPFGGRAGLDFSSRSPAPSSESGGGMSVTALEPFRGGVVVGTASHGIFFADAERRESTPLLPSDPVTGLVGTDEGVLALSRSGRFFLSPDGGRSWKTTGSVSSSAPSAVLLRTSGGMLLVGGAGGVSRSGDGRNWTRAFFPVEEPETGFPAFPKGSPAEDPVIGMVETSGDILAATWRNGILRSRDEGLSWERVEGNDGLYRISDTMTQNARYRYIHSLASDGGMRVAVGTDLGFSVSSDGGGIWRNAYVNYGITSVMFDEEGMVWGTSRNGLWRCDPETMEVSGVEVDGYGWSPLTYFTELFRGKDGIVFATIGGELVRLTPLPGGGGYAMGSRLFSNVKVLSFLSLPGRIVLMGTRRGFFRSEDGGKIWNETELP